MTLASPEARLTTVAVVALGVLAGAGCVEETVLTPTRTATEWQLIWSDEFDGPAGRAPDATKWGYNQGGDGWGNQELQHYTDRTENAALDGEGRLVITARQEAFQGNAYTSARLLTQDTFTVQYGRIEASVKMPVGAGLWPAFWMLGDDFPTAGWPECGEIDILEYRGQTPDVVLGSLHGPGYSGGGPISGAYFLPGGGGFNDAFHTFAVEWDPGRIAWYVDDQLFHVATTGQIPGGGRWVYDHPFFLILNMAVGGGFVGPPNADTAFPAQLLVDHVRVYQRVDAE